MDSFIIEKRAKKFNLQLISLTQVFRSFFLYFILLRATIRGEINITICTLLSFDLSSVMAMQQIAASSISSTVVSLESFVRCFHDPESKFADVCSDVVNPAPFSPSCRSRVVQSGIELSMGWVDPWVGSGWVTRNGPMDNSGLA